MSDLVSVFASDLLPIFVIAGAGFALARWLKASATTLTHVVFFALLPCFAFRLLINTIATGRQFGRMVLLAVLVMVAMAGSVHSCRSYAIFSVEPERPQPRGPVTVDAPPRRLAQRGGPTTELGKWFLCEFRQGLQSVSLQEREVGRFLSRAIDLHLEASIEERGVRASGSTNELLSDAWSYSFNLDGCSRVFC